MEVRDPVYGDFEITEPVLIELINSKSLQRLKRINQFGLPEDLYSVKGGFPRYDHSVGTMLLLKKLGAGVEEQVAGLLHDVSHTAFSHLIDFVIGNAANEDYQDMTHESFIKKSEIPEILSKHGFDVQVAIDYKRHGLLEREIPDLCADR